jgi:ferredoxin-NADP reductase
MPAVRWREATIEQIVRRTPHAASVFFSNPLGPHRAGQHVDLRLVADDGYEARRSYSIASAPDSDRIELLIERLADGEVSPYFHDVARAGDTIELLGPLGGHFVWPRSLPGPLLLVAGGSGIAPLMAMLRHRARALPAVPAALLYGGRTWDELAFRDELLALADASPSFALTFATTREAPRRPRDVGRRIDAALVAGAVASLRGPGLAQAYLCGSTGFVETAAAALIEAGIAPARINAERYGG